MCGYKVMKYTSGRGLLTSIMVLLLATILSACGGGSSSNPTNLTGNGGITETGDLLVSLTDAEGDFLTYAVDISNLTLTHRDGTVVSVLPETTRVDFAQYVDVSELLSITSAPLGAYLSASITLDFSSADITVQDELGNAISASVVGEDGAILSETTLELNFNGDEYFVLSAGVYAHITLDFDLDASNDIEISESGAVVTVNPVMLADALHSDPKALRLRGRLGEVNAEQNQFTLQLHPFVRRQGQYGQAQVHVGSDTQYEVNGEMLANAEGLQAMNRLAGNEPLVISAQWNQAEGAFYAAEVYAGTSVPWGTADTLRGTVVARSGNIVSVRGAMVEKANGHIVFSDDLTLSIADTTIVHKHGEVVGLADISVGSAVNATGDLISDNEVDAANGIVRISRSKISGTVANEAELAVDLHFVNGRRISLFDFAGTGTSEAEDADPGYYEVDTGLLDISSLMLDTPVRIRGFVNDFGAAPSDFVATSIADASDVSSTLKVMYHRTGSDTAVVSNTEAGLMLNVNDAYRRHHVMSVGMAIDLKQLEAVPLVHPAAENGVYCIAVPGRMEMFQHYADFVVALDEALNNGMSVQRFDAHGNYDSQSNQFSGQRLQIALRNNGSGNGQ
ncbi:hypothetical protein [Teredinibacter haidensis]|uniref:hypothetical protein n=1 Tax=Teredinibacter haidensis TaxID=2731755 RepID=UPI000948B849|nr:hypothetical protein [Teredinibacter haidensis]